jgi:serine/threonine protein kinase
MEQDAPIASSTPFAGGTLPEMEHSVEPPEPPRAAAPPGTMSALLQDLARTPEGSVEPSAIGLWPGCVVGRFELVREIGRGGFGVVYEARDHQLGRLVAFKAIRSGSRVRARHAEEWLLREAEAAAQLAHPNVATLYDAGRGDRGPYLVFELLEGETLGNRIARGPLPVREAVRVATEVARALTHAHAAGVVHCDLKPSNVFLTSGGAVKVLDFGLARVFGESRVGSGGTPAYMAPEQWRGEREDARADIFALGVMLYETLTGALPFEVARDRSSALDPGPAPPLRVPGVPAKLVAFVAAALAKEAGERPRNGQVALEALLEVERELERATPRHDGRGRALRWGAAVGTALALLAVAAALTVRWRSAPAPERITVAVADFANETGDPALDGLSGMLITSLEPSNRLSVLTRSRTFDLLKQLGQEKAERIDERLAREAGRVAGARALLLASIRRFDELYRVELNALDPVADEYLFTLKEEARGKANIPGLIDRISERTREALREKAVDVSVSQVNVSQALTGNLEAYRHYFLGEQCMNRFWYGAERTCARHFQKALAEDPRFALAHYQLAVLLADNAGPMVMQRSAIEAALRDADRMPGKERTLALAWRARLDRKPDEALSLYGRVIEAFPADKWALCHTGLTLLWDKEDAAAAVPYFERAVALDPWFGRALDGLIWSLGVLGRRDEIRSRAESWSAAPPSPSLLLTLSSARAWLGERQAAVGMARQAVALGGGTASEQNLAAALLFADQFPEAEAAMRRLAASADAPAARFYGYYGLASALAYQGRRREALRALDALPHELREPADRALLPFLRAEQLVGEGSPGPVWRDVQQVLELTDVDAGSMTVWLAYLGDLEHASGIAAKLVPGSTDLRLYQAMELWHGGDRRASLERVRGVVRERRFGSRAMAPYLLAELCVELGEDREALEAVRTFHSLYIASWASWRGWAYPKSLYLMARSHERLGQREEARAAIETLLAMWRNADPDLPLLGEARALRARLAKAEPARAR